MQTHLDQTTLRIVFDGDLLSTNVHALRPKILEALSAHSGATSVVGDLVNVGSIDSMGLNLLIALYQEAQARKLALRFENPSPDVLRVLSMLNLLPRFGLKPDEPS